MDFPPVPLWDFAIDLYAKPGVGAACLDLQQRHEVDVNILLFCIWLGVDGYPAATAAEMARYRHAVHDWHEQAVRGLRAVRKWMKTERPPVDNALAQALRARIQKAEIDAEHLEQVTLFYCVCTERAAPEADARLVNAATNIRLYFRECGIAAGAEDDASLVVILRQAFPTKYDKDVAAALSRNHV